MSRYSNVNVTDFESADRYIGHGRLKRNVEAYVRLRRRGPDEIVLEWGGHYIIRYLRDGITYLTPQNRWHSTKRRLNKYSPAFIWQRNFVWYYTTPALGSKYYSKDAPVFTDWVNVGPSAGGFNLIVEKIHGPYTARQLEALEYLQPLLLAEGALT